MGKPTPRTRQKAKDQDEAGPSVTATGQVSHSIQRVMYTLQSARFLVNCRCSVPLWGNTFCRVPSAGFSRHFDGPPVLVLVRCSMRFFSRLYETRSRAPSSHAELGRYFTQTDYKSALGRADTSTYPPKVNALRATSPWQGRRGVGATSQLARVMEERGVGSAWTTLAFWVPQVSLSTPERGD